MYGTNLERIVQKCLSKHNKMSCERGFLMISRAGALLLHRALLKLLARFCAKNGVSLLHEKVTKFLINIKMAAFQN